MITDMKIFFPNIISYFFCLCLCCISCATRSKPNIKELSVNKSSTVHRETFDPSTLKDDRFLIQPIFSREQVQFTKVDTNQLIKQHTKTSPLQPDTVSIREAISFPHNKQKVFRVQLLALSNGKNSLSRYKKLTQQLTEPVYIEKRGDLFLISAGDFENKDSAISFKDYVIELNQDYSDAFVISANKSLSRNFEKNNGLIKKPDNIKQKSIFGWRVLIDQFLTQEKANTVKNEAEIQLRRHDIDVVFKAPWYKIEVGHYINENIVQTAAEKIQRFYPNAIKVRSQIIAPENKD